MSIKEVIEQFIKDYTVPYNTEFAKRTVEIFTCGKEGQNLDDYFGCRFIFYNGERKIIIKEKGHPHDFYVCEWEKNNEYSSASINNLINDVLDAKYYENPNDPLDDRFEISLDRIKEINEFFGINLPVLNQGEIEGNKICFSGNGWDNCAQECLEDSDLFTELKDSVKKYLQYEYAPYRKYNPDFNPFRYAKANKDYDMIFETLDRNQILNALISILDKKIDKEKVKKFYYTLNDNSQIKMFIEALGVEDKMVIRCNTLYNL